MKLPFSRRQRRGPIAKTVVSTVALVATIVAARAFPELRRYLRMRSM
jgi:hypothetical protein